MARDVQREARFAHTGAGCQNQQVGAIEARDRIVQRLDAGGDALIQIPFRAVEQIEPVERFENDLVDPLESLHIFTATNVKYALLRRIQQGGCVRAVFARVVQNPARRLNQRAHIVFVAHDLRVGFHVRNRGHDLCQLHQVRFACGFVKARRFLESLQNRHKVDGLAEREHFEHRAINQHVIDLMKIIGTRKNFRDPVQTGGIQQNRAQNGLLRLGAER